jgi:hydroxyacylglutathione hydrolase
VGGYFDAEVIAQAGLRTQSYPSQTPQELRQRIENGGAMLVDVRALTEFQGAHIPGAKHHFLGGLPRAMPHIDGMRPFIVHCQGGGRSAIAASLLQRAGFDVTNMSGGFNAWIQAGLPVARQEAVFV